MSSVLLPRVILLDYFNDNGLNPPILWNPTMCSLVYLFEPNDDTFNEFETMGYSIELVDTMRNIPVITSRQYIRLGVHSINCVDKQYYTEDMRISYDRVCDITKQEFKKIEQIGEYFVISFAEFTINLFDYHTEYTDIYDMVQQMVKRPPKQCVTLSSLMKDMSL